MGQESFYESRPAREAELYTVERGNMFRTTADNFVFKAYGRTVYVMSYVQAQALHNIIMNNSNIVPAVTVLKAFVPNLDLKVAGDIVRYVRDNFKPCI